MWIIPLASLISASANRKNFSDLKRYGKGKYLQVWDLNSDWLERCREWAVVGWMEMENTSNEQRQNFSTYNLANKVDWGTGLLTLLEVGKEGQNIEKMISAGGCCWKRKRVSMNKYIWKLEVDYRLEVDKGVRIWNKDQQEWNFILLSDRHWYIYTTYTRDCRRDWISSSWRWLPISCSWMDVDLGAVSLFPSSYTQNLY